MKKFGKKFLSLLLSAILLFSMSVCAFADREEEKPFLSLGAEQTQAERAKVLELLGIKEEDLSNYNVLYVTNKDEHTYLGSYMSKELIGTRALSSVLIKSQPKGTGISVTCTNINYCTPGMYRNALITAGVTDAEVQVVAPSSLPGTAALVGAMKSFEAMTGESLSAESKDAATNELIATGELGKNIGDQEKAEELVGLVKQEVVDKKLTDENKIGDVIDEAAKSLEVNLSEKDRKLIQDLMAKISKLDLNIDSLKTQAKDLYDKLSNIKIDQGVWDSIVQFFRNLWDAIVNFFTNLFGGGNNAEEPTTLAETTTAAEITTEPEQTTTAVPETEPVQNITTTQVSETQVSATEEPPAETTTAVPPEE